MLVGSIILEAMDDLWLMLEKALLRNIGCELSVKILQEQIKTVQQSTVGWWEKEVNRKNTASALLLSPYSRT